MVQYIWIWIYVRYISKGIIPNYDLLSRGAATRKGMSHESIISYSLFQVISTRKVQTEDGTLFLDMKCGNLMQQRITRIQTELANEIARLIRQYITIDQRIRGTQPPHAAANGGEVSQSVQKRGEGELFRITF